MPEGGEGAGPSHSLPPHPEAPQRQMSDPNEGIWSAILLSITLLFLIATVGGAALAWGVYVYDLTNHLLR